MVFVYEVRLFLSNVQVVPVVGGGSFFRVWVSVLVGVQSNGDGGSQRRTV